MVILIQRGSSRKVKIVHTEGIMLRRSVAVLVPQGGLGPVEKAAIY